MSITTIAILIIAPAVLPIIAFGVMKYGTFGYVRGKMLARRLKEETETIRKEKDEE